MEFEKEYIIILIVCLIIGFVIGISINTHGGIIKGSCTQEKLEINILTKEINNCLQELTSNQKQDTNIEQIEK